jgi:hypothetical protein
MTAQWPQGPKRDKTTKETQWPLGYRIPSGGQSDWPLEPPKALEALEVPKVPQKEEPKG